jgi:hypothetical protein
VERGEDDVEAGHHRRPAGQAAIRQDVDLAAVQDRQLGVGRPEAPSIPSPAGDAVEESVRSAFDVGDDR